MIPPIAKPVTKPLDQSAAAQSLQKIEKAILLTEQGSRVDDLPKYIDAFWVLASQIIQKSTQIQNKQIKLSPEQWTTHQQLEGTVKKLVTKIQAISLVPPGQFPNLSALSSEGKTLLHWAVETHQQTLASQLLLLGYPLTSDKQGITPLDEALLQGDFKMAKTLLASSFAAEPILSAMLRIHTAAIEKTIENLRQIDPSKLNPISLAAYQGDIETLEQAERLDTPDAQGLTPLHYALLGQNPAAITFLINHFHTKGNDFYYLTPKGHSYLDYAIITQNSNAYTLFRDKIGVPFRLAQGKDAGLMQELYLFQTGIVLQMHLLNAIQKDPLAMKPTDAYIGIANGVAGALNAVEWLTRNDSPIPWSWSLPCLLRLIQGGTHGFSAFGGSLANLAQNLLGLTALQQQGWLPKRASDLLQISSTVSAGCIGLHHLLGMSGMKLPACLEFLSPILANHGPVNYFFQQYPNVASLMWKGFAVYKTARLARSLLPRIGSYYKALRSRPDVVRKKGAFDALNMALESANLYNTLCGT